MASPTPSVSTGICRSATVPAARAAGSYAAAGGECGGSAAAGDSVSGTASPSGSSPRGRPGAVAVLVRAGSAEPDGEPGDAASEALTDGDVGRPGRCRPSPAGRPASDGEAAACRVGPRTEPGPVPAPGPVPDAEAEGDAEGEGVAGEPEASSLGRTIPTPESAAGAVSSAYAEETEPEDTASTRTATAVAHRESSLGATG